MADHWFYLLPKTPNDTANQKTCYRAEPAETPRTGQHSSVTGEEGSISVESGYDEDTAVSDGSQRKQSCRAFSKRKKHLRRRDFTIGTWNIRTMCALGKLELLLKELEGYNLKVTELCETRWSGSGVFSREDHTIVYSGTDKGGRSGVAVILDKHHV